MKAIFQAAQQHCPCCPKSKEQERGFFAQMRQAWRWITGRGVNWLVFGVVIFLFFLALDPVGIYKGSPFERLYFFLSAQLAGIVLVLYVGFKIGFRRLWLISFGVLLLLSCLESFLGSPSKKNKGPQPLIPMGEIFRSLF